MRAVCNDELERRLERVKRLINDVTDPCSVSFGVPIGIVDMGIVDSVDVSDGAISVRLLPTFPGCLYLGAFEQEITKRLLAALDWCTSVYVTLTPRDVLWDESRLADSARVRLERRRSRARAAARTADHLVEQPAPRS